MKDVLILSSKMKITKRCWIMKNANKKMIRPRKWVNQSKLKILMIVIKRVMIMEANMMNLLKFLNREED